MSWTIKIEVVAEEHADEVIEVLRNAEEDAELNFGFNTSKSDDSRTFAKGFVFDADVYNNAVKTLVEQVQLMAEDDSEDGADPEDIAHMAEQYIADAVEDLKNKLWEAWPSEKKLDEDGYAASTDTKCAIHGRYNCGACC